MSIQVNDWMIWQCWKISLDASHLPFGLLRLPLGERHSFNAPVPPPPAPTPPTSQVAPPAYPASRPSSHDLIPEHFRLGLHNIPGLQLPFAPEAFVERGAPPVAATPPTPTSTAAAAAAAAAASIYSQRLRQLAGTGSESPKDAASSGRRSPSSSPKLQT